LVLEKVYDDFNQQAVLRTAESLGIQHIWSITSPEKKNTIIAKKITRGNHAFLSLQKFKTTAECIDALRKDQRTIWATDLSTQAVPLDTKELKVPAKLAIVIGSESAGVSKEMLEAADKRVFLPMYGFSESLNLSVAAALVLQHLFQMCPEARGDITEEEKKQLRKEWYDKLAKNALRKEEYRKYLDNPPPVLDDLRKPPEEKKELYIPPKIKKRIREREKEQSTDDSIKKQKVEENES